MDYRLSIRPNRTGKTPSNRGSVEYVLATFSSLRRETPGVFVYGPDSDRPTMRIHVGETDPVESIRITIPARTLRSDGGSLLRLCFKIADRLGWGILDEQMGAYLERDAIPDVLARYQEIDDTVTQFLSRKASGRARFWIMFQFYLRPQTRLELLALISVAAFIAGIAIVSLDGPLISFLLVSVVVFAGLVSAKALVQSLYRMKRHGNPIRNNPA